MIPVKSVTLLFLALELQGSSQGIIGMSMATQCSPRPPDCWNPCNDTLFYDAGDNHCQQCLICPQGYEPDGICGEKEGIGCVPCPDDKFSTSSDQHMCDECRKCTNTVGDKECLPNKDRECGPCAPGFGYIEDFRDVCFACKPGHPFGNQDTCQQSDQVFDQGDSSKIHNNTTYQTQQQCYRQPPWCNDCEGVYSEDDDGVCQECLSCPPGTEPEMGNCKEVNMKCIPCPAGKFSMEYDNYLCDACSLCTRTINDTPCNATHDTLCGPCEPGYGYLEDIRADVCFSCSTIPETQRIKQETCQITMKTTISVDVPNTANAISKSSRKINGIFGVLSIFAVVAAVLAVRLFYKRGNGYQAAASTDSNSSSPEGSVNTLSSENNHGNNGSISNQFQQETSTETEIRLKVEKYESTIDQKLSSVPVSSFPENASDSPVVQTTHINSAVSHNMPSNSETAGEIKIGSLCSEGGPFGNHESGQDSTVNIQDKHSAHPHLRHSRALVSSQHNEQNNQPDHNSANFEHAYGHSPESNIVQFKHHMQHPSRFGNLPSHNIPTLPNIVPKSLSSPCQYDHGESQDGVYHNEMSDFPTGVLPIQNASLIEESHADFQNFATLPKMTESSENIKPVIQLPTQCLPIHYNDNEVTSQSISKSSGASGSEKNQRSTQNDVHLILQNPNTKPQQIGLSSLPSTTTSPCAPSQQNVQAASNPWPKQFQPTFGLAKKSTQAETRFLNYGVLQASKEKKQTTSKFTDVITQPSLLPIAVNNNARLSGTVGSGANGGGTIYNNCQIVIKGGDVQIGNNNYKNLHESAV